VYRDYGPKQVKFFFIYKSLAHPELDNNYIQPFTMDERLAHARQAVKQLGAAIPWLVDPMDNRIKHALGDRANSEFVIAPDGRIVRKRAWSDPSALRRDLEELVGPVEKITQKDDITLNVQPPLTNPAPSGAFERLSRGGLFPLITKPETADHSTFYVKLRAEADLDVIDDGQGRLYLGFHLDPFHEAHWNNLTEPLRFEIDASEGVLVSQRVGEAPRNPAESDSDPREFMLDVKAWPEGEPIRLTVHYAACTDRDCYRVQQHYVLLRQRDADGGNALVAGFRGLTASELVKLLMAKDKNRDGKLTPDEMYSLLRHNLKSCDHDGDGTLDENEIQQYARQATRRIER
jgi:hypothetical protein